MHADSLFVSTSSSKIPEPVLLEYHIQVKYRPSFPDNLKHWQIFEDDEQLKTFLQVINEFSNMKIEEDKKDVQESNHQSPETSFNPKILYHDIIQLSNNFIPKGLVPLEKLFDNNDVSKNPLFNSPEEEIRECNIGTLNDVRNVKLSSTLTLDVKIKYLNLLKNYKDVSAWSYNELKTYDTSFIEHKIPLKPEARPFQQKLRRINPILLPTIEKELK